MPTTAVIARAISRTAAGGQPAAVARARGDGLVETATSIQSSHDSRPAPASDAASSRAPATTRATIALIRPVARSQTARTIGVSFTATRDASSAPASMGRSRHSHSATKPASWSAPKLPDKAVSATAAARRATGAYEARPPTASRTDPAIAATRHAIPQANIAGSPRSARGRQATAIGGGARRGAVQYGGRRGTGLSPGPMA